MYRNKYTAAMFAMLWGAIWLHKLYLGNWLLMIAYIILCLFVTPLIPAVIWFFEWIWYLSTLQVNFDKTYNKGYIKDNRPLIERLWLWSKKDREDFILGLVALAIIWIIYYIW